jgi:fumarate reductase flavoprotein subunit
LPPQVCWPVAAQQKVMNHQLTEIPLENIAGKHPRNRSHTIEELAEKIGVPVETFKETVERYNEVAKAKKDTDFGKRPELLTTIEEPPFYALKFGGALLTVNGGVNVDTNLQVLDKEYKPIPGLYAVGNTAGGLYGVDYPTIIPGNSHGRALTWGYVAGKTVLED